MRVFLKNDNINNILFLRHFYVIFDTFILGLCHHGSTNDEYLSAILRVHI
jgi:hypothetical protein